jgi:DNA-binding winged helix-turn-helix (wHTH) protein
MADDTQIVRFGSFEFDHTEYELRKDGVNVKLQGQPFEVLALLLERPGHLVTRERFRERLWPAGTIVEFDHCLHTAVTKLREALGDGSNNLYYVETVPRHGYRFTAPVLSAERRQPTREAVVVKVEYPGACHCGALHVRYHTAMPPSEWSVRACQCSFCSAHGALSASDPGGSLRFSADDETLLHRYRFGTHTAEFWLCRCCGVYVGATIDAGFGIVNVRALRPMPEGLPAPVAMSYEGEVPEARRARRINRWTPLWRAAD